MKSRLYTYTIPTPKVKVNQSIQISVKGKMINAKTTSCNTENRTTATANSKQYLCFYNYGSWAGKQI